MYSKDGKEEGRNTLTSLFFHPLSFHVLHCGTQLETRDRRLRGPGNAVPWPVSGHKAGQKKILVFPFLTGKVKLRMSFSS